jgi:hypothetical protein
VSAPPDNHITAVHQAEIGCPTFIPIHRLLVKIAIGH